MVSWGYSPRCENKGRKKRAETPTENRIRSVETWENSVRAILGETRVVLLGWANMVAATQTQLTKERDVTMHFSRSIGSVGGSTRAET